MKVLFDSNVIIDALSSRVGKNNYSVEAYHLVASGEIVGVISAKQITDIHYVLRKYGFSEKERREIIRILKNTFEVLPLLPTDIALALKSDIEDFEDAVLDIAAKTYCIDFVVTGNVKNYKQAKSYILTPEQLVSLPVNKNAAPCY